MKKFLKIFTISGLTISSTSSVVACTKKDDKKNDDDLEEIVGTTKEINQPNGWVTINLELENELRDQEIKLESKSLESILDIGEFNQDKTNKKLYICIVKYTQTILPLDSDVKESLITKIDNKQIGDLIAIIVKQHVKTDISDINPLVTKEWSKQKGENAILDSLINKQLGIEPKKDYEIDYDKAFIDGKFVPGKEITVKAKVGSKLITGIAKIKVSDKTDIEYLSITIAEGLYWPPSKFLEMITKQLKEFVPNVVENVDYKVESIVENPIIRIYVKPGFIVTLVAIEDSKLLVGKLEIVVTKKPEHD